MKPFPVIDSKGRRKPPLKIRSIFRGGVCGADEGVNFVSLITLPTGCRLSPSWRRQGSAPPAGRKSPLIKAISKFGVRAQRTALMRMTHASPSSQKSFLRKYFCEVSLFFHFVISGEADPSDGLSPATSPNKVRGGKKSAPPFATISDTSKIAILRSMPLFAADAAWVEMVNAGEL